MATSVIVRLIADPSEREMSVLVAVNGPIVAGVEGTSRVTPEDGIGSGIVSS